MWTSRRPSLPTAAALSLTAVLVTAGCSATGSDETARATSGDAGSPLTVLASFYPLQYVAEQVGGDRVTVSSLTPPGAEPHDLELSPRQVREVGDADVVLYLSGFQPAVDEAITARSPEHVVDATATPAVAEHLTDEDDDHAGEDEDGADEGGADDDGHGHSGADPHFWLDPALLAAVAHDVADALTVADPAHADEYAERSEALTADLAALDQDYAAGLESCERRVIVTAHESFGYLAERYALEQVGISGLDPEAEPSPARLREIRDVAAEHGVTTVFTEALLNPKVATTLADDLGISTAVLDPVESQTDAGTDYRGAMEQNLDVLREALACT